MKPKKIKIIIKNMKRMSLKISLREIFQLIGPRKKIKRVKIIKPFTINKGKFEYL